MKLTRDLALKIILAGLLLGILTDILVRQNIFGLNFFIFVAVWTGLCLLASVEHNRRMRTPLIYAALALANAGIVFWRASPLVQFWSVVIALVSLGLLAATAFVENYRELPLISRVPVMFSRYKQMAFSMPKELSTALSQRANVKLPLSRGVIGAIVLGIVFIALFASADQVLGRSFHWLGDALQSFVDFTRDYNLGRFMSIGFWSLVSLIALLLLLHRQKAAASARVIKQSLTRRDAHLILWTLTAIFAVFVALQLRYLFTGGALPDGLTYATYAHRGYGQLLVATLLASAVIKYVITALKETATRRTRAVATALVVLNGIVVLSAWKRLSLYETTYGWTLTRFVARLGLVCILLGSFALLAWLWGRLTSRRLYASGWYILTGVLMCAAVLNPEDIIARKNITERSNRSVVLDAYYVAHLSDDALPTICAMAPQLRQTHPQEYKSLKDELETRAAPTRNHGLSRHATARESFILRYTTCL